MSDNTYKTEQAQIEVLIEQHKDKIAELEELKKEFNEDWSPEPTYTPGQVAAAESADSSQRAAAANQATWINPETVNSEQSYPTPSTHDSAKEETERRYAELHQKLNEEAQRDDRDADRDSHSFDGGEYQGVEVPDGRRDPNKVAESGTVEAPGDAPEESKEKTVEANDADDVEKKDTKGAAAKQAETNQNKSEVASKGKTADSSPEKKDSNKGK